MKLEWDDTSSWSRSDSEGARKTPKEWTVQYGQLRVTVHHYAGCGDAWFVSCHQLNIVRHDLRTKDSDHAKAEAVFVVRNIAEKLFDEAQAIYKALGS